MMTQSSLESPELASSLQNEKGFAKDPFQPTPDKLVKDSSFVQPQNNAPKSFLGPPGSFRLYPQQFHTEKRHSLPNISGQFLNVRPPLVKKMTIPPNPHGLVGFQNPNSFGMPPTPTNGITPFYVVPVSTIPSNFQPTPPLTPRPSFNRSSILPKPVDVPVNSVTCPSSPSLSPIINPPVSNLTGRRKALLIGINYFGTEFELKGPINDIKNIKEFLTESYNFPVEGMVIMTDDQIDNPARMPTKKNIEEAMKWLVDGARPNDSLFLHFSGHGAQTPDLDGDEEDGFDETICPVDFKTEGMIVDDDMNSILVRPLPAGCRLTVLFDCCHSGTALDLPYIYNSCGELKTFNPGHAMANTLADLGAKTQVGDLAGAFNSFLHGVKHIVTGKQTEISNQKQKGGLADVIMFSGCEDCQTSADLKSDSMGTTGALSLALIAVLRNNPNSLSYLELLNEVRRVLLENKFSQNPQLSTSRPMDMNSLFQM